VIVAVREVVTVFAAAVNPTEPLAVPVAPDVIEIHMSVVDAVQLQPAGAVTLIVPDPPPATTDWDAGEIV
jgi:hypothetical protein